MDLYIRAVEDALVDCGAGNDTVVDVGVETGGTEHVSGGAGDDTFYLDIHAGEVVVDGGVDNYYVDVDAFPPTATVLGGDGNDELYVRGWGNNLTVLGGNGTDQVSAPSMLAAPPCPAAMATMTYCSSCEERDECDCSRG
eukprot:jgi/Mesvir1/29135/Mv18432-RA.1